ncbi:MAG: hypothetical protein AAFR16_08680 [Pseudomonadota bacterium]
MTRRAPALAARARALALIAALAWAPGPAAIAEERAGDGPCVPALGAGVLAVDPGARCRAAGAPARATAYRGLDCARRGDCAPLAADPDLGDLVRRAQSFFEVEIDVYRVDAVAPWAALPYMLPRRPPAVPRTQVHLPRAFLERVAALEAHQREILAFVIGHEAAHAYQERAGLLERLRPSADFDSLLLIELQADYLGAFFAGVAAGVRPERIDAVLEQIRRLPSGRPRDRDFHGFFGDRFSVVYMGFLNAPRHPGVDVDAASNLALDVVCLVGRASLPPRARAHTPAFLCDKTKR